MNSKEEQLAAIESARREQTNNLRMGQALVAVAIMRVNECAASGDDDDLESAIETALEISETIGRCKERLSLLEFTANSIDACGDGETVFPLVFSDN